MTVLPGADQVEMPWAPSPGPAATAGELLRSSFEGQVALRNHFWIETAREEAYDRHSAAVREATGIDLGNPLRTKRDQLGAKRPVGKLLYYAFGLSQMFQDPEDEYQRRLGELAQQRPEFADVLRADRRPDFEVTARAAEADRVQRDVALRRGGQPSALTDVPVVGAFTDATKMLLTDPFGFVSQAAGGMSGMMLDPANAATMFVGPLRSVGLGLRPVLWSGVKNGVANAVVEGLQSPATQAWRKAAGLDYGLGEATKDVEGALAAGFLLDVGVRSAYRGARRLQGRTPLLDAEGGVARWQRSPDGASGAGVVPEARDARDAPAPSTPPRPRDPDPDVRLEEAARDMPPDSLPRRALEGDVAALEQLAREVVPADDPAVRGALAELDHFKRWGEPPEVDKWDHLERLTDALARAQDPRQPPPPAVLPMMPDRPAARLDVPGFAALAHSGRQLPDGPQVISRTDFEARNPAGQPGVKTVTINDETVAFAKVVRGSTGLVVTEFQTLPQLQKRGIGARLVEDLRQEFPNTSIRTNMRTDAGARLFAKFDRGDGEIGNPAARALSPEAEAARVRLADGDGGPVELALLMREHPDAVEGIRLSDTKQRQALAIAAIEEGAFRRVLAGEVAPNHAALIGRHAGDHPGLHAAIVDDMARMRPRNEAEARLLIGEHINGAAAGKPGPAREVLGGVTARELAPDRARVLAAGLKAVPKDGRFRAAIETWMPQTKGDAKLTKAAATRLGQAIEALARADTEVARLLDDAALAMRSGISHKQASAAFVDRLAGLVERDGIAGLAGRETAPEARGSLIDDPAGPEAKAQAEALARRIKFSNPGDNDNGRGSRNARGAQPGDGQDQGRGRAGGSGADAGRQRTTADRARERFLARAAGREAGTLARAPQADGRVLAVFEARDTDGVNRRTVWLHKDGAAGPSDKASPRVAAHMYDQLANWLVRFTMTEREPGRWEVNWVSVRDSERRKGLASQAYDALERLTGQPVMPSGQLTKDGISLWRKRRPEWVQNHRYIDAQELYLSPRELLDQVRIYQALLQLPDASRDELHVYRANLQDLRKAIGTVPKAALKRAALAKRWSMPWAPDLRPAAAVDWPAIRADVDRVINRLPPGIRGEVRERIVFGGRARDGFWDPHERLIAIALNERAGNTVRHEELHVLKGLGLIRDDEWAVLVEYARKNGLAEAYDIEGRWGDELARTFGDDELRLREALLEETIAEMMGRHRFGERFGGVVDQVLARVRDFIERLGNALAGRGFQSAHDVFRRIDRGEVAARPLAPSGADMAPGAVLFQQQDRPGRTAPPGLRPRKELRALERIPVPGDLGVLLGNPNATVWIRIEHILTARHQKGGAEALGTAEQVQAFVRTTLAEAKYAYRYKKGDAIYNFVHEQPDGSARIVSMGVVPNAHGQFSVITAFPSDRASYLNKLSAAARMWGRDGFQIMPGRREALEGLLANVSEAHRAAPSTFTATLIDRLSQERRLRDEALAKQTQAPAIDETDVPLLQRQAAEQAAEMQREIDRAMDNPAQRQWYDAEQMELFGDLAALCKM